VLLFAFRGLYQGILRQFFDLLGWVLGIGSCMLVSQWVGAHWTGARPAVVFAVLGWLVAVLAGLAIKALFQVWGERLADGANRSGGGLPDRLGGLAIGAVIGMALVSALLVGMLLTAWPPGVARTAAHSRLTGSLLAGVRNVLSVDDRWIPGAGALERAVNEAARRARELSRQS